ncbi:MAG: nucleotide exchange factor GrpE [Gammaproteobacteria bacterium]|nr:nucleotide exchange factor GrpE [Gammaproteobacteria bacterium]NIN61327.1 nucleotide exchange factor GrpE [Gammaproteobacteria bacterium]NIO61095.1 nucleotide exchange factor GrpE [Gammaproteobacteria bacterium]NIP48971.1 nucleotide exchange factor GrpE [Gammaproteobacteria bacterium]NIQ09426.1 nucleotide exchange factor GrpE [Gammaproteobacteria bacterium]
MVKEKQPSSDSNDQASVNENDTLSVGPANDGAGQQDTRADETPEENIQEDADQSVEKLMQKIEVLKKLANEHKDNALRARADLENMRKRTIRDIENAHKYALKKFVDELLPVLDSLELGISASNTAEDIESLKEGMDLTCKKFASTLEKFGVKVIDPQGEKFNPELHEAVSMQEQEGMAPGTVISVMQKGYELNGRLVRPAMVMVAK